MLQRIAAQEIVAAHYFIRPAADVAYFPKSFYPANYFIFSCRIGYPDGIIKILNKLFVPYFTDDKFKKRRSDGGRLAMNKNILEAGHYKQYHIQTF